MGKPAIASLVFLMVLNLALFSVDATVSVGVIRGDWVEYQAIFTGAPPEGHEVTWAKSEVTDVQGPIINLNITTEFADGTLLKESITLNLETGQLGDEFIIPANLDKGDTFEDKYNGNVTISSVEEKAYAGATRPIVSATVGGNTYYWDQKTGVLVEGISEFSDYSIHSLVDKTNMWEPDSSKPWSMTYYVFFGVAIAVLCLIAVIVLLRKKAS